MNLDEVKEFLALYIEYWAVKEEIEVMVDQAIKDLEKQTLFKQSKQRKKVKP